MTNEELEVIELDRLVKERRRVLGLPEDPDPPEPKWLRQMKARAANMPDPTPEQIAADEQRQKAAADYEHRSIVQKFLARTQRSLGKYAFSSLANYEVYAGAPQQSAVDRVARMEREVDKIVGTQTSVIFLGTLGTGKDYLAACLLLAAAREKYACEILSGRVFYDECAAAFANDSSQLEVYRERARPTVLCLSDPVFEAGWSPKWGEYLNRLIRMRYDSGKATWATVNATSVDHAREMFGFDVWDRLIENSILIEMRWPSYRTRKAKSEY